MQQFQVSGLIALEHDLALVLHHCAEPFERMVGPVGAKGIHQLVSEQHQGADDKEYDKTEDWCEPFGTFGPRERRGREEHGNDHVQECVVYDGQPRCLDADRATNCLGQLDV